MISASVGPLKLRSYVHAAIEIEVIVPLSGGSGCIGLVTHA